MKVGIVGSCWIKCMKGVRVTNKNMLLNASKTRAMTITASNFVCFSIAGLQFHTMDEAVWSVVVKNLPSMALQLWNAFDTSKRCKQLRTDFYIVIIKSCCTVILQLCVDILLDISHQAHRECYSRCPVTSWAELAGCLLPTIYVQVSSSLGNVILLEWSHIDLPKGATGKGSAVRHPYYYLYFE